MQSMPDPARLTSPRFRHPPRVRDPFRPGSGGLRPAATSGYVLTSLRDTVVVRHPAMNRPGNVHTPPCGWKRGLLHRLAGGSSPDRSRHDHSAFAHKTVRPTNRGGQVVTEDTGRPDCRPAWTQWRGKIHDPENADRHARSHLGHRDDLRL